MRPLRFDHSERFEHPDVLVERLHASILQYLGQLRYHSRASRPGVTSRSWTIRHMRRCPDVFVFSMCAAVGCRVLWPSRLRAAAKQANEPRRRDAVADASARTRVPIGSPVKLTYKFVVAPERDVRQGLLGVRPRARSGGRAAVDRRPPAAGADVAVEAGADDRVHADDLRAELSLHRRSGRPARPVRPADRQAPDAERAGGVAARSTSSRSSSCCRSPRTSSSSTRTAGIRPKSPPTTPTSEWQWTKKTATLSFRNPKKDVDLLPGVRRPDRTSSPRRSRSPSGSGDQPIATFAADSKDTKLLTFPITAAQLGAGDMVGARPRRRPDVQPRRRRPARARASASSTPSSSRSRHQPIRLAPSAGPPSQLHLRGIRPPQNEARL